MTILPEDEELTIKTGGKTLGGWTAFSVGRGIEKCPSYFQVGLTERYPDQARQTIVEPFSPCEVFLSGDKLLTGYIDHYEPAMSAQDHEATIAGRSKTEDLVDCSVDIENTGWVVNVASVGAAAKKICDPYNIKVEMPDGDVSLANVKPFSVIPGMTCWQLLEEVARAAQLLIWDDAEGRLVLSKAGTKRAATAIVEGQNAEIAGAMFAGEVRYSDIGVVASAPSKVYGHLTYFAKQHDPRVPRRRLHLIVMDQFDEDAKWPQERADWEVSRRYGRSRQIKVTVTGWRDGAGVLWTPNTITRVSCPTLKIDEDWLIVECNWQRGQQGTQTVMLLMPRDGVVPEPFHALLPIPVST